MGANNRQVGGNHYSQDGVMQHWDMAWNWNYDSFEYCISKYVERYERKNGLQDLEKARHHMDKYMEVTPRVKSSLVPRVSMAMSNRIEALECNDYQGAVLLYLHTRDLVSASHYLDELIKETDSTNEGEATRNYVDQ